LKESREFNQYFGLSWSDRINRRLLFIFSLTASAILIAVIFTANIDYYRLDRQADELFRERFIERVTEFLPEPEPVEEPVPDIDIAPRIPVQPSQTPPLTAEATRAQQRREIGDRLSGEGVLAELSNSDPYSDLPVPDDLVAFDEDAIPADLERARAEGRLFSEGRTRNRRIDPGDIDDPRITPFNYNLSRRGNVMIEFTDELIHERKDEPVGYRDPDEINRVVHHYRPMIEFCFNREARFISGLRGYVKVRFSISYEGHVLPESIRIVSSTIRNRAVEQCIKNYIKRWRDFEKLDESMGIAQVVQKFIFN
jgi:hypothetical protein